MGGMKNMNEKSEKMLVLELLGSGKITADEAAKLLEALGTSRFVKRETRENVEEKLHNFANDVTKFAKDVGCKVQELYKSNEPKIKKASHTALEKAAAALDSLAQSIGNSIDKAEVTIVCCDDDCTCDKDDDAPKPN